MQILGESVAILADDLTGACDTALQFHLAGGNTRVLMDYTAVSPTASTQTWVVNTDSRHLEPAEAAAAVRQAVHFLRDSSALNRFYKKIDSTLRGHIAQECLAILDEIQGRAAIIAPAYPDESRRTVGGYQLVRGIPVGQTETAIDPLFPVRESHLPTLLAKTSHPDLVGYIPLSKVMDGAGPILKAILDQIALNKKLIVVDACSDVDLEQLSLAITKMPSDMMLLPCGSAGLAKALSKKWLGHREPHVHPRLRIETTPFLMAVGTASAVTRNQVRTVLGDFQPNHAWDPVEMVSFRPAQILEKESISPELDRIMTALKANVNVIISTSFEEDTLSRTMILAEEYQLSQERAAAHAANLLANIVQQVVAVMPVKLILSGGETANTVCKAIGSRSLQIVDQVDTSIPLMIDEQARWIITKSGSFGEADSLYQILRTLKAWETVEETQHA